MLRAVPALLAAAVSLKHPAISKGLSVASFPVLFHFLATSYTADLQASQNASMSPWQGMLEMPGRFPWELGSTRRSGPAPSLPAALLASSPVYLHHPTNGSPSWVPDGASRPNCRGELLAWPSAHLGSQRLGTSPCPSDPGGCEPGRRPSGREGGWTPALDLTSWTSICIFRSRSQPVGCLRPPHSL